MVEPGVAATPPSVLVTDRSDVAATRVDSMAVLSAGVGSGPLVPSSATVTVLVTTSTPAGGAAATSTANTTDPEAPGSSPPMARVHVAAAHTQRGSEPAASKVVSAGTASVRTTPVAA